MRVHGREMRGHTNVLMARAAYRVEGIGAGGGKAMKAYEQRGGSSGNTDPGLAENKIFIEYKKTK
jgi:hypothetical protein